MRCDLVRLGMLAVVVLGGGCATPAAPTSVETEPPAARSEPPKQASAERPIPKLPIALDDMATCVIESGRGHCRLPRHGDHELPFDGVQGLGAAYGFVCALHGDLVDCHRPRDEGEPLDLRFEVLGAVEIDVSDALMCAKTESRELHCHHFDYDTGTPSPMTRTLVASEVVDFELDDHTLAFVDAQGTTRLTTLRPEEHSEGTSIERADELDLPLPNSRRVAFFLHEIAVVTTAGEVWTWSRPRRRADPVEPAARVPGVEGALDVAVGLDAICATTEAGVWCAGNNSTGLLGPTERTRDVPMTEIPVPGHPVAVETSSGIFCAGDASSPPYCWGAGPHVPQRGRYEHPAYVVDGGSTSIDVSRTSVCSTDGEGRRLCYGPGEDRRHNPFTMERGWEPESSAAVERSGSCSLHEDGTLRCFGESSSSRPVVETEVSRFSAFGGGVCYVRRDGTLGCASEAGRRFDLLGIDDAVDVIRWPSGACILTANGKASCFDIPADHELRRTTDGVLERFVWRPRLRRVRGAQGLTELEATSTLLCGLGSENTVDCWERGKESQRPRRLELAAKTLRLSPEHFGCGLTVESRPYCMTTRGDIQIGSLPPWLDHPVEELELFTGILTMGPVCTRDAEGRVGCVGLYQHPPILWPPMQLTTPLE